MVFLNPIAILMATLFSIVIAAPTVTGPAAPTATDLTNTLDVATPGTRCGSLTRKWGGEDDLWLQMDCIHFQNGSAWVYAENDNCGLCVIYTYVQSFLATGSHALIDPQGLLLL
jgi:hypothetical protein